MKIAILTANLGNFDTLVDPVRQVFPDDAEKHEVIFHRFDDENFPPITGLSPRLQYRIPKLFGWQYFPSADVILWLDGSMSLAREDSLQCLIETLAYNDMLFFKHPWRKTIEQEVNHIEEKLQQGNPYITARYKNGLHLQQLGEIQQDPYYDDAKLYASNVFMYRNKPGVHRVMDMWWFYQSRYYTCDQVALPYAIHRSKQILNLAEVTENIFKSKYISLVSKHK
jgi:hypothetical protein